MIEKRIIGKTFFDNADSDVTFDFDVVPIHKENYFIGTGPERTHVIDSTPIPDRMLNVMWSMHYNNKCRKRFCRDPNKMLKDLQLFDEQLLSPPKYATEVEIDGTFAV